MQHRGPRYDAETVGGRLHKSLQCVLRQGVCVCVCNGLLSEDSAFHLLLAEDSPCLAKSFTQMQGIKSQQSFSSKYSLFILFLEKEFYKSVNLSAFVLFVKMDFLHADRKD